MPTKSTVTMTLRPTDPVPLLEAVLKAVAPFSGAKAAAENAIAAAKIAPVQHSGEVHPDEVENYRAHGWVVDTDAA